jgi:biopolymer transport protein ExbD
MPVHTPSKVLLHHIPLKFVSARVSGGARKSVDTSISLVPFIDFLIVLVVFLLTNFGSQIVTAAQDDLLRLPDGVNTEALEEAPIIAINRQVVMLDGRRMADTASLASTAEMTRIEQLVQDLETLKRNWGILHPQQPFAGVVIIQADINTDYRVVKKVMFSTAQAGYSNVSFAVNATGD